GRVIRRGHAGALVARAEHAAVIAIARARSPSDRAPAIAFGLVAGAFACTLVGPLWLLLAAPLVLGVPHVVADVHYLVVRGPLRLSRRGFVAIGVPLAAMTVARVVMLAGAPFSLELDVVLGLAAIAGA